MFLICLETTSIFKDKENMSRLEELIQKLCPEGIGYKTLGEIATDVFRGAGITRDQVRETGTPCVRYGEIYTTYGIWFEDCVSHTDESLLASKKYFGYGDILFAITGESVDEIAKCCAYIGHETCLAGGDIVVLRHNEDPKIFGLCAFNPRCTKAKEQRKSQKQGCPLKRTGYKIHQNPRPSPRSPARNCPYTGYIHRAYKRIDRKPFKRVYRKKTAVYIL